MKLVKIPQTNRMRVWLGAASMGFLILVFFLSQTHGAAPVQEKSAARDLGGVVTHALNVNRQRGATRKQSDKFSNILLTSQHGRKLRFYDDLIKDKVVMINLMYTTCAKICPANSARLAEIHDLMQKWMGRDITVLSLSIDSKVDTPARMKSYWQAFGAKPGWLFLTGDYDEIEGLRRELGVYDLDPVIDADKTQHSGVLTIGNDRTDRWIALPVLMHTKQLAASILRNMWDENWHHD